MKHYKYKADVEQLALISPSLRHYELLTKIAADKGAQSWEALLKPKTFGEKYRHFTERFTTPRLRPFIPLDDVLYGPHALGPLSLGQRQECGIRFELDDGILRRHTLVLGGNGVGKYVLICSLLEQQMARGGGFLFIDAQDDWKTRESLRTVAAMTGTPFVAGEVGSKTDDMPDLVDTIRSAKALYFTLPLNLSPHAGEVEADRLKRELSVVMHKVLASRESYRNVPFLVVLPSAKYFRGNLSVFLSQARASGLAFILVDDNISYKTPDEAETVESVLQNTWTKVFFRNAGRDTLRQITEQVSVYASALQDSLSIDEEELVAETIATLQLGEAIAQCGNDFSKIRLQMVHV